MHVDFAHPSIFATPVRLTEAERAESQKVYHRSCASAWTEGGAEGCPCEMNLVLEPVAPPRLWAFGNC